MASQADRTDRYQLPAISFQLPAPAADISALVYEVERLHHGTPSGIDNTVVVYGQPVYFVRGQPPQTFHIGRPFTLAIADTGIAQPDQDRGGGCAAGVGARAATLRVAV